MIRRQTDGAVCLSLWNNEGMTTRAKRLIDRPDIAMEKTRVRPQMPTGGGRRRKTKKNRR